MELTVHPIWIFLDICANNISMKPIENALKLVLEILYCMTQQLIFYGTIYSLLYGPQYLCSFSPQFACKNSPWESCSLMLQLIPSIFILEILLGSLAQLFNLLMKNIMSLFGFSSSFISLGLTFGFWVHIQSNSGDYIRSKDDI